jgi:mono/diheme cytochrome c family protein
MGSAFAAALAFLLALTIGCRRSQERMRIDFERMRLQQRADLYGASALFPNGQSMQASPVGTISRESVADSGVVGTGTVAGIATSAIPVPITAERLAVGKKMFGVYCAVCHGVAAYGGSIVAENMGAPRPPSLRRSAMLSVPDGYFFVVATHGTGRMPSYASQLTPDERWSVVAYLKQLQHTPSTDVEAIEDSLRALEIVRIDSAARLRRRP